MCECRGVVHVCVYGNKCRHFTNSIGLQRVGFRDFSSDGSRAGSAGSVTRLASSLTWLKFFRRFTLTWLGN